jgi:hypothetical protein
MVAENLQREPGMFASLINASRAESMYRFNVFIGVGGAFILFAIVLTGYDLVVLFGDTIDEDVGQEDNSTVSPLWYGILMGAGVLFMMLFMYWIYNARIRVNSGWTRDGMKIEDKMGGVQFDSGMVLKTWLLGASALAFISGIYWAFTDWQGYTNMFYEHKPIGVIPTTSPITQEDVEEKVDETSVFNTKWTIPVFALLLAILITYIRPVEVANYKERLEKMALDHRQEIHEEQLRSAQIMNQNLMNKNQNDPQRPPGPPPPIPPPAIPPRPQGLDNQDPRMDLPGMN